MIIKNSNQDKINIEIDNIYQKINSYIEEEENINNEDDIFSINNENINIITNNNSNLNNHQNMIFLKLSFVDEVID